MPFETNPRLPGVKVEIAFDSGFSTLEGARTWTDVSADVSGTDGLSIGYGRTDQQPSADPNQLTLTLKNNTGKFTPGNASSPYYPNVKKGKPIRVSVTYAASVVRFTGYVNEWPVVWPDGSDRASQVTITAASRRARLGQTAPLTSAIRAAYLATSPLAYWPMDEDYGAIADFPGSLYFRDVSNLVDNADARKREYLTTWWDFASLQPVVHDGSAGPTDEESLVRFPPFTDIGLYGSYAHYVGGGSVTRVNTAGEATMEVVGRIQSKDDTQMSVSIMRLLATDLSQRLFITVTAPGVLMATMQILDPATADLLISMDIGETFTPGGGSVPTGVTGTPVQYAAAVDGNPHHYAVTLSTGGTVVKLYFDGALVHTLTLPVPFVMNTPLTGIAIGSDTYYATAWAGHAAVHDRALSAAEILAHAQAATAATETTQERVVRVAGRIGVAAAEVDAEATIAADLGPQPEAGRSAVEVLDELATSTGGILYDTRAGHLAMQARNHRYNKTSAFTLNTASEEIEVDLTVVLNDQYLVNSVDLTRSGSDAPTATLTDAASISEYGVYSKSLQIVSASDQEVVSAGQDQLYRYGTPRTRISQVSIDIGDLKSSQRDLVLAADIGTLFTVSGLPAQAPASSMALFVEGYTESVSVNGGHVITFNTTSGDPYQNVLVWDDPTHGAWDSNIWAY